MASYLDKREGCYQHTTSCDVNTSWSLYPCLSISATSSTLMPKMNRFSSPASSAISTLAPSMVPMVRAPFSMNFMLPVPEASVPAVEICSDRSVAGITGEENTLLQTLLKEPGFEPMLKKSPNGTFFCKRDPVVLQEDDLQLVSHHRVIIHHVSHRSDQLDDHLGHVIPRSSLQGATVDHTLLNTNLAPRLAGLSGLFCRYLSPDDHCSWHKGCSGVFSDTLWDRNGHEKSFKPPLAAMHFFHSRGGKQA